MSLERAFLLRLKYKKNSLICEFLPDGGRNAGPRIPNSDRAITSRGEVCVCSEIQETCSTIMLASPGTSEGHLTILKMVKHFGLSVKNH